MPERERRSSDPLLKALFDQSERQHEQNSGKLDEMQRTLNVLATADVLHGHRLGSLEGWREKIVDPFIAKTQDLESQVRGAGKVAKATYVLLGALGGTALFKLGAAQLAAMPK